MTDSDLRELDGWIAEHFMGWFKIKMAKIGGHRYRGEFLWKREWGTPDDPALGAYCSSDPEHYSSDPSSFALVKREIERRGGSWNCRFDKAVKQHGDWPYWFTIWMPDLDQSVSTWGETEELAGCLAIKAAVEGSK